MTNKKSQLSWYTGGFALWMGAYSLQQLLVTWILIGMLQETPERVGLAQLLIGIPGLLFLLWGGVIGDRMDGRVLLIRTHYLSAVPPLVLALASCNGLLGYWILILTALFASLLNSASSPVRNTILNAVAGRKLQFAISLSTGIGSIAAIAGTRLGGEIESLGLNLILIIQALVFVAGGLLTGRLLPAKPTPKNSHQSTLATIAEGLKHVWEFRLCRDLIGLNFISSLFNAGGWIVAFPFIINRVYDGNATLLANMLITFTFGSLVANFGLLNFMPLKHPGRLYLGMQLSRVLILILIWVKPSESLLWLAAALWGFNMGITTTTSRLMLQEIGSAEFRARIMAAYNVSLMSAAPIGSMVLGVIIGLWGPLNALIPGMIASVLIFSAGFWGSEIWHYRSPQPEHVRVGE
ncbi:MAG TPA: MFS transporter [Gammaproteobacteria bacterium]|nr:MFS transporter [Gammaproteobacteria bacterium]HIL98222.1 MFS transporter [Pseudomonadales bacterium]